MEWDGELNIDMKSLIIKAITYVYDNNNNNNNNDYNKNDYNNDSINNNYNNISNKKDDCNTDPRSRASNLFQIRIRPNDCARCVIPLQTIGKNHQVNPAAKNLLRTPMKNINTKIMKNRETNELPKLIKKLPNTKFLLKTNKSNDVDDRNRLFDGFEVIEKGKELEKVREKEKEDNCTILNKKIYLNTIQVTNINLNKMKSMNINSIKSKSRETTEEEEEEGNVDNSLYLDEWFQANPLKPRHSDSESIALPAT